MLPCWSNGEIHRCIEVYELEIFGRWGVCGLDSSHTSSRSKSKRA